MIYEDPLSTLKAKESVFFFDDLVIALGSDISASEDGEVQTTLFQSGLTRDHDSLVVNGTNYSGVNHSINGIAGQNTFLSDPYSHLYYLPESGNLRIETARQKSKSDNGKKVTIGDFATARLVHGSRPKEAQYEYAIQIHGATKANNMSNIHPDQIYQVQRNDKTAHIVAYLPAKCTGFALFERHVKLDHTVLAYTDTPCLVMTREEGTDQLTICVTNPELGWTNETISFNAIKTRALWYAPSTLQPVHLTLHGQWQVSEPNEAVSVVSQEGNQTVIRFNCLDGATIQTQLKRD